MRLGVLLSLTAVGIGAAACAGGPQPPGALEGPGPAPVAGYDWFLHKDDATARLAFGLAESDDLRLGLDCDRGSGRLALSASVAADAPAEIRLEAGDESATFPADSEPSQLDDGLFLSAEARAVEPVFQRFRRTGWLAMWRDGERQAYVAQPGSAERIDRFFAFCG